MWPMGGHVVRYCTWTRELAAANSGISKKLLDLHCQFGEPSVLKRSFRSISCRFLRWSYTGQKTKQRITPLRYFREKTSFVPPKPPPRRCRPQASILLEALGTDPGDSLGDAWARGRSILGGEGTHGRRHHTRTVGRIVPLPSCKLHGLRGPMLDGPLEEALRLCGFNFWTSSDVWALASPCND